MVLLCKLCSRPIEVCLNSETRPRHTLVCIDQGVESECGENSGTLHVGLRWEQLLKVHPPPCLDHSPMYQGGCNI